MEVEAGGIGILTTMIMPMDGIELKKLIQFALSVRIGERITHRERLMQVAQALNPVEQVGEKFLLKMS